MIPCKVQMKGERERKLRMSTKKYRGGVGSFRAGVGTLQPGRQIQLPLVLINVSWNRAMLLPYLLSMAAVVL